MVLPQVGTIAQKIKLAVEKHRSRKEAAQIAVDPTEAGAWQAWVDRMKSEPQVCMYARLCVRARCVRAAIPARPSAGLQMRLSPARSAPLALMLSQPSTRVQVFSQPELAAIAKAEELLASARAKLGVKQPSGAALGGDNLESSFADEAT